MSLADSELIRRFIAQRAEDAFAELVRRHIHLVYGAALRKVRDPHLAEEVVQAVFTALAWKAASLVRHETIAGWLHTATRFAANELLRTEYRRRRREHEAGLMNQSETDEAEHPAWEELRPVLDDALGELNPRDRDAVLLRFFAQLSFAEIGLRLRVTENTARMRVDRALDKLHGLLARRGITSTSAALALVLSQRAAAAAGPTTLAAHVTSVALASATAGIGSATAIATVGFGKFQSAITAAAALALCAVVYEAVVLQRLETRRANAVAEHAANLRRLATIERELDDAQRRRAALRDRHAAVPAASASPQTAPATGAAPSQLELIRDRYLQRRAVARSNPEYQRLQAELRKHGALQDYGPLLQRLKLSPEQIRNFQTLVADHSQAIDDIDAAAETQRLAPTDSAIERLKAAAEESLALKMRELLGPESFGDYERHRNTLLLRATVTDAVALALYATDAPLTAAQADALTHVLDRHTAIVSDGTKNDGSFNWDAAMPEAERVLNPKQRAALRAVAAQRRWTQKLAEVLSPMVAAARDQAPKP